MPVRLTHPLGATLIGTLEVTEVLGAGAYGTVYRCRDRRGGPERAVKEMHAFAEPVEVENALRYFRREAHWLTRFDHPAIPHAEPVDLEGPFAIDPMTGLEVAEDSPGAVSIPARHFLVMEFVDGSSLEEIATVAAARNQVLPAQRVLGWGRQILQALGYLHQHGLVHGDVKPAHILVRRDDRAAMLIDYGLCREAFEPGGYGTVPLNPSGRLGTPGYAPPDPVEQEHPAARSDLHALAMSLRRALTGLDPTDPVMLRRLRAEPLLALRDDLDEHEAQVLDRAIAADPGQRPESAAAFVQLLSTPPAPLARPVRASWIELRPPEIEVGPVAPGEIRDLELEIRDRRPGVRPEGTAESKDDRLRILPATAHGADIRLHLVLRIPRTAAPGPVTTRLAILTAEEELSVPVRYLVDPTIRPPAAMGCMTLPAALLGWRG